MKLRSVAEGTTTTAAVIAWLITALLGVPLMTALGLWLLGVPLDWSSWKTFAGLAALAVAMVWAGA
jgi:hypothetical protein